MSSWVRTILALTVAISFTDSYADDWSTYAEDYARGEVSHEQRQQLSNPRHPHFITREKDSAAGQWREELYGFLSVLQQRLAVSDTSLRGLTQQYLSLKEAQLLQAGQRQRLLQRLTDQDLVIQAARLERVMLEDAALFDPLFAQLDESLPEEKLSRSDRRELLQLTNQILARMQKPAMPALRASILPYGPDSRSRIAPVLSPTVTPAYDSVSVTATPDDLSGSTLAPLTDPILLKAQELEYDPIQIFEFVYGEIDTSWYHGAMKGAEGTLAQGSGNSEDQAALLVALMRAASLPARYVRGVIQLDVETLQGYLGVAETDQVLDILIASGIPHSTVIQGGAVGAVRLEHTWVTAEVPYSNYRGTAVDRSGPVWLPLFPALKTYDYTTANNLLVGAGIDATEVRNRFLASSQPVTVLQDIEREITESLSGETLESQQRSRSISARLAGLLPATLPVEVIATTFEGAELPDGLIHKVRFVSYAGTNPGNPILDATFNLSEVASQRVTLSYQAGTYDDQRLINASGGLLNAPAYLISVRPQIKIAGLPRAIAGDVVPMGAEHLNQIQLIHPSGTETISKPVIAGGYEGIGIVAGSRIDNEIEDDPADTEQLAAKLLSQIALNYSERWQTAEDRFADYTNQTTVHAIPSVTFAGNDVVPEVVLGRVERINWQGVNLDAALRRVDAVPSTVDAASTTDFYRLSALHGSELEHLIFEDDFDVESISADKAIALTASAGNLVDVITPANRATLLPGLAHSAVVIAEINGLLDAGYTVTTPRNQFTLGFWEGAAWAAEDPATGAGGYFISRALAGAATTEDFPPPLNDEFADPYADGNNPNSDSGETVGILTGNFQFVEVDTETESLRVIVRDSLGRPVRNARVEFFVRSGSGELLPVDFPTGAPGSSSLTLTASPSGLAEVVYRMPQSTFENYTYRQADVNDVGVSQVGVNYIGMRILNSENTIESGQNFTLFATAGPAHSISAPFTTLPASQNLPLGPIRIDAADEFGNPVSEADVEFSIQAVVAAGADQVVDHTIYFELDSCPDFPSVVDCGGPLRFDFTDFGGSAYFFVAIGNAVDEDLDIVPATFPVRATLLNNPTATVDIDFVTDADIPIGIWRGPVLGAATEPGGVYNKEMKLKVFDPAPDDARTITQVDLNGVEIPGSDLVGLGSNELTVKKLNMPFLAGGFPIRAVTSLENGGTDVIFSDPVAVVDITPTTIPPLQLDETNRIIPAQIAGDGSTYTPELSYTAIPSAYIPQYAEFIIRENGVPQVGLNASGDDLSEGTALLIDNSLVFKPSSSYTYEVVFNGGTEGAEVRSDEIPLPTSGKIILSVRGTDDIPADVPPDSPAASKPLINASSGVLQIDLLNGTTCKSNPSLELLLNQPAVVDLIVDTNNDGQFTAEDLVVVAGQPFDDSDFHTIVIDLPSQNEGRFPYLLVATDATGEQETNSGLIFFRHKTDYSLPVGHANHAGVDLYNGNLSLSRTDISVTGRGRPLEFTRSYSSSNNEEGPMGIGWTHNLDMTVSDLGCAQVVIRGGDAGGIRFNKIGAIYEPTVGYHGTLEQDGNTWDFYSKNGTRYHFKQFDFNGDREWSIEFIEDTNGNRMLMGYQPGGTGNLEIIEDASGRQLRLSYETKGTEVVANRLTSVTGLEYELLFDYDEYARLTTATMNSGGLSRTETYEWDGPLTDAADPDAFTKRAAMSRIIDARGNDTQFAWEVASRFVVPGTTDFIPTTFLISRTQRDGGVLAFEYGGPGGDSARGLDPLQTRVISPSSQRVAGISSAETLYTMNPYGSPIVIESEAGTQFMTWKADDVVIEQSIDEEGRVTDFTYDEHGNIESEQVVGFAALENEWTTRQDGRIKNLLLEQTDRNGNTTTFDYDENGNLTDITYPAVSYEVNLGSLQSEPTAGGPLTESFVYAPNGDRITAINKRGLTSRFTYDSNGYVATKVNPLGGIMTQTFDDRGRMESRTDEEGRTTTFTYDGFDRLDTQTDALDGEKSFSYDLNDNKLDEQDEEGRVTEFEYDEENRVSLIRDALLNEKTLFYDDNGNLITESDFRGNNTEYRYDGVNRQVRIIRNCGPANTEGCSTRTINRSYDNVGNIKSEARDDGWFAEFEYDDLNRQTRITQRLESDGGSGFVVAVTDMEYDDHGNLTKRTDAEGRIVDFEYDGLHRLTKTTERAADEDRITEQFYDGMDNVISTRDGNGNRRVTRYDDLDRPFEIYDPLGHRVQMEYDAVGNVLFETDELQRVISMEYDDLNRLIRRYDALNFLTEFEYDKVGNLTLETWPATSFGTNKIDRTYDDLNRQLTEFDEEGPIIQATTYDADGNLTQRIDGNGNITQFDYNAFGELIETRVGFNDAAIRQTLLTSYDNRGNVTSQTNGRNFVTSFEYDLNDRLVKTIDARLEEATMTYDGVGNKLTETDFRGNTTAFEYDEFNRVTTQTDPDAIDPDTGAAAHGNVLTFTYDLNDNVVTATDKRGLETENRYDARDLLTTTLRQEVPVLTRTYDPVRNVVSETDANGNVTNFVYTERNELSRQIGELQAITNFFYDSVGNQTEILDPENRQTLMGYDLRRRLIASQNGEGEQTQFEYDNNDNQTKRITPRLFEWEFDYDALDRLEKVTDPGLGDTLYVYDLANNLTSQTDARGNATGFAYDELDRRISITYPGISGAANGDTITFDSYDPNGNLTQMTDARGIVTTFAYDELNRQVNRSFTTPADAALTRHIDVVDTRYDGNNNVILMREQFSDSSVHTTSQLYDDFDRMIERIDPYSRRLAFGYDLNGNRIQLTDPDNLTTTYVYDKLNRVESVTNPQGTTNYGYDDSSLMTAISYPNDTHVEMSYDAALRTINITNTLGLASSTIISSFDYEYDDNGNRTKQTEENGGAPEETTYVYDALDRLTSVSYPDETVTYTYDAVYNRDTEVTTAASDGSITRNLDYVYDTRNQLTDTNDLIDPAQSVVYTFDGNGNQISKTTAGVTTDFVYDARDNLRQVTVGGSTVGQFLYDDKGMRIEKLGDRGTERYTYDDLSVITQSDGTNATIAKYDYGPTRLLSLTDNADGAQFYLTDTLGSVTNLTRTDGGIQARYQYDAFGNYRNQVGSSFNRFGFTGHEVDTETGLMYFKARFYDPETGRFLSHDAFEGELNTPPSLHKYLYVFQNPTVFVDPTGNIARLSVEDQRQILNLSENPSRPEGNTKIIRFARALGFDVSVSAINGVANAEIPIEAIRQMEALIRKHGSKGELLVVEATDTPDGVRDFVSDEFKGGKNRYITQAEQLRIQNELLNSTTGGVVDVSDARNDITRKEIQNNRATDTRQAAELLDVLTSSDDIDLESRIQAEQAKSILIGIAEFTEDTRLFFDENASLSSQTAAGLRAGTDVGFTVAELFAVFKAFTLGKKVKSLPGSEDPGLDDVVDELRKRGVEVKNTNVRILGTDGNALGEVDIVTQNAVIQVKTTSSAKAVIDQVKKRTEPFVTKPVVTFVQNQGRAGNRTVKGAKDKIQITNDIDELAEKVK